jgi:biopolymer transport protein ExbD
MLLLIFFLLTSQFVIMSGIKIKLPGSKTSDEAPPSQLVVTVTADGLIYAGNNPVSLEALGPALKAIKGKTGETVLVIRPDKAVPIERIIKVIDSAKANGINKFTLETEKETGR